MKCVTLHMWTAETQGSVWRVHMPTINHQPQPSPFKSPGGLFTRCSSSHSPFISCYVCTASVIKGTKWKVEELLKTSFKSKDFFFSLGFLKNRSASVPLDSHSRHQQTFARASRKILRIKLSIILRAVRCNLNK